MSHFYPQIQLDQIIAAFNRITKNFYIEEEKFSAEYAVTPEPVQFKDINTLTFKPIEEGTVWGKQWDCAWFRIKGEIPKTWKGSYVVLKIDLAGETCIFDLDGNPLSSVTHQSIFDPNYVKERFHLMPCCEGGEKLDFWLEAGANGLFGVTRDSAAREENKIVEDIHGTWRACVNSLRICKFDYDRWQLSTDLRVIIDLVKSLPDNTARKIQILRITKKALDFMPIERGGYKAVREALKPIFELGVDPATVNVHGIGHAHIDTAWLWPVRETIRKVGRTFATQISLIEKYDEYKFGASQPQLYTFCKERYPSLYKKIKKAVADKRWELQGAMWVEADCNIPNGESLVRQIVHGKNFYKDEFGEEVKNVWLPDVFGYSGNLPQFMKKAGVDYFLTQKLSWNIYNVFPHNSFIWRGIDGSEVVAHFPPEDSYNSSLDPSSLRKHETNNKEAGLVTEAISLFGIGDGGGGPTEEYIERGIRCKNLNGCPKFNFSFVQSALEKIGKFKDELDTWDGELYFEMHRGTYTTQTKIKLWNRRTEEALRATEFICSMVGLDKYPAEKMDELWKRLLINHFHDIIPGSSIARVYKEAVAELKMIVSECNDIIINAVSTALTKNEEAITLFNPSSTTYNGLVKLPGEYTTAKINGKTLTSQNEAEDYYVSIEVPAQEFVSLELVKDKTLATPAKTSDAAGKISVLENELVRYEINDQMHVTRIFDKESNKEIIPEDGLGNVLRMFNDIPHCYDAWDIDENYMEQEVARPTVISIETISGPLRNGVMAVMQIGNSLIQQTAWLEKNGKRLDFVTNVDWNELHKLLRVEFDVTPYYHEARYEVQYGTIARPTNNNTKWQYAQFEVLGHRYADLSQPGYGVAMLTDSKYGYRIKGNKMSLSLLRAPINPDPLADLGQNTFTYSILPHKGILSDLDCPVLKNAAELNQGLTYIPGYTGSLKMPVKVKGDSVEFSVLKKAEKENCLVVRIAETHGRTSNFAINTTSDKAKIIECDLMEWNNIGSESIAELKGTIKPFEIKTFKIYQ